MPLISKHRAHMAGRQIRERTANNMPGIHDPKSKS